MALEVAAPAVCRVLDLDPELGLGLDAGEREKARRACRGFIVPLRCGSCELSGELVKRVGRIGLVIVEGMVCRELALGERHMFELLGPGDVIGLPAAGEPPQLGSSVSVTAGVSTVVVALGESFVRAAARWPCLLEAVLGRLEAQRERLALQGLIAHLARAEDRVLLALWLLGNRWGQMTPDGTLLSLALTHDLLGQLTASRRSTVTIAVSALESGGSIRRLGNGSWLLTEQAGRDVALFARTSSAAVLGESFVLRQRLAETRNEARALRAEALQAQARHALVRPATRPRSRAKTLAAPDNRPGVRD